MALMSIPELLRWRILVPMVVVLSRGADVEGKYWIRVGCATMLTDFEMVE
jgi:hypothetical protein